MCNPHTSVAIMNEAIANGWQNKQEGLEHIKQTKDFLQYERLKEELIHILSSAEEIYFLGGEPTLIDSHLEILDYALEQDYAKNITLRWSTNLTHFDERYIQRAQYFKKVILDCSIDGYGDVNDYIRYPSKWSQIESQLFKIQKNLSNAHINIVCTIQIYNIFEIEKFIHWCDQNKITFTFNYLDHPKYLSVQNLPMSVKQVLINEYKLKNNWRLNKIAKWLSQESQDDLMDLFWKETKKLDATRKQSFTKIIPAHILPLLDSGYV
jgi:glutamate-1-semialdehyde 2,1-aminomutase